MLEEPKGTILMSGQGGIRYQHSVGSSLVSIGVRSSDSSVGISLILLGKVKVDVLVSVSNVAKLILSLKLRDECASDGSGSSISSWDSSGRKKERG